MYIFGQQIIKSPKIKIKEHECVHEYIGQTATRLERRLWYHTYARSIKDHYQQEHNTNITLKILKDHTKIIEKAECSKRLNIIECISILRLKPKLNKQIDNFNNILKLYKSNQPTYHINNNVIADPLPPPTLRHSTSPIVQQRILSLLPNVVGTTPQHDN